eukprot:60828-Prorocentrum_minimum.AAC.1
MGAITEESAVQADGWASKRSRLSGGGRGGRGAGDTTSSTSSGEEEPMPDNPLLGAVVRAPSEREERRRSKAASTMPAAIASGTGYANKHNNSNKHAQDEYLYAKRVLLPRLLDAYNNSINPLAWLCLLLLYLQTMVAYKGERMSLGEHPLLVLATVNQARQGVLLFKGKGLVEFYPYTFSLQYAYCTICVL